MEKKKVLLIIILIFVLLLGGASLLYGKLSGTVDSMQLAVEESPAQEVTPEEAAPQEEDAGTQPAPQEENTDTQPAEPAKVPAPDFTVYDLEGNEVRLYDYIGKPIVLNFWASWCGPCKMEMPDFNEKYLELGDEVHFLMVNMTDGSRETVETASSFIAEQGYQFPVFYDSSMDAAMTYGAYSLPTTYFIDAEGYAIAHAVGAIDAELLMTGIGMIYQPE